MEKASFFPLADESLRMEEKISKVREEDLGKRGNSQVDHSMLLLLVRSSEQGSSGLWEDHKTVRFPKLSRS